MLNNGDLVVASKIAGTNVPREQIGVIIGTIKPNQAYAVSQHMADILRSRENLYYVFFGGKIVGPTYWWELSYV